MKGRKVAILFAEGSDKAAIDKLKKGVEDGGGTAFLVAPKVGELAVKGGKLRPTASSPDRRRCCSTRSPARSCPTRPSCWPRTAPRCGWFMDAYGHCKTIGYCPATKEFILDKLGIEPDAGVGPERRSSSKHRARSAIGTASRKCGCSPNEAGHAWGSALDQAQRGLQLVGEVGLFPREEVALGLAPEMAVGGGRRVDRLVEAEAGADAARGQPAELLDPADRRLDLVVADRAGAVRVDVERQRLADTPIA